MIDWVLFTDASTQEKAVRVMKRVIAKIEVDCSEGEVQPYHKGGYRCFFTSASEVADWSESVVTTITLAQKAGRAWIINGSIEEELDMWSNDSSISGVESIHLVMSSGA